VIPLIHDKIQIISVKNKLRALASIGGIEYGERASSAFGDDTSSFLHQILGQPVLLFKFDSVILGLDPARQDNQQEEKP
jgi:hypothetical protein